MKDLFKQPLAELNALIEAMSLRGRILVVVAGLSIIYGICALAIVPLLKKSQDKLDASIAASEKQIADLGGVLQRLESTEERQSDAAYREKVLALQAKQAEESAHRAQLSAQLVAPQEMAELVENLLSNNRQVEVLGLKNSAPLRIDAQAPAQPATQVEKLMAQVASAAVEAGSEKPPVAEASQSDIGVYRHALTIEIKGRYWDIVRLLKSLEEQPRRILWGEVKLVTATYPYSVAEITLYTLNMEAVWMAI